jgi:putative ABC transport system substrate-binding protein
VAARGAGAAGRPRPQALNPFVENDAEERANLTAFRQTLEKLGWSDGRNVRIDYRWGSADPARIRAHAKELVSLDPDVILVSTALALQPLQQETRSIPIIFARITCRSRLTAFQVSVVGA